MILCFGGHEDARRPKHPLRRPPALMHTTKRSAPAHKSPLSCDHLPDASQFHRITPSVDLRCACARAERGDKGRDRRRSIISLTGAPEATLPRDRVRVWLA